MARTVAGWRLEQLLGRGSFGEVWRARKRSAKLERAIKLMPIHDQQGYQSWRHEITRLEAMSHPNIVRFHDAGIVTDRGPYQGYAWITTELCERSLAQELMRRPSHTLSPEEADRLLEEMLAAMAAAHGDGIVHRDIKPGNILRHTDGVWKVCDFGTARLVPPGQSRPYTTVIGTVPYMSAEALRGRQDYAADLYALGATLHEALSGRTLHHRPPGMADGEYIELILNNPPKVSTQLHTRWQTVIKTLIDIDRADSPQGAAQQLLDWFRGSRGVAPPPWDTGPTQAGARPNDPVRTPSSGTGDKWGWAVLGVIAIVGGLIWMSNSDPDEAESASTTTEAPSTTFDAGLDEPWDDGDEPDETWEDNGPESTTTTAPTTTEPTTTTTTRPPPPAVVGGCIAVSSSGSFEDKGSCANGGAPYLVTAIREGSESCPDSNQPSIVSEGYRLCIERNLVVRYCYDFRGNYVTPASCRTPGTVHVVDILQGAASEAGRCTQAYEWNRWYEITYPQMVVCVMQY